MSYEYAEGEYEAERARRIAANRAKLREIGVTPLSGQQPKPTPKAAPRRKRKAEEAPAEPTRRSSRVANQGEVDYKEPSFAEGLPSGFREPGARGGGGSDERADERPRSRAPAGGGAAREAPAPAPGSSKGMDADLQTLRAEALGELILPVGGGGAMKAAVMVHASSKGLVMRRGSPAARSCMLLLHAPACCCC